MIKKITLLNSIQNSVIYKIKKICNTKFRCLHTPQYELPCDTLQLSTKQKSAVPLLNIITGKFDSGIRDERLAMFHTEYRAYDYEGYDNIFPNDYICVDSKGDRRLKPHIYLNSVLVKPEFARQGVYSDVIRQLKTASQNEGCEGRIILFATKMEGPDVVDIPSPSIAHWKCGFRFANPQYNDIMQRVLLGKLSLEDAPEGIMYMPCD